MQHQINRINAMMGQTNDLINSSEILLASFQAGDMDAFSKLYDLYINILFNYGAKLTLDRELLKDCIHDIFVKLYVKREELGTINNLKSYLFIALKNKLCDELRKRMYMSDIAVEDVKQSASIDIEKDFLEEERRKNNLYLIKHLMDKLSPRQREALTLYYIEEKKYEDICVIMNMNYQSVRNLMCRGLSKLRSLAS